MNTRQITFLILALFGSFAVVLAAMIVILRLRAAPQRPKRAQARIAQPAARQPSASRAARPGAEVPDTASQKVAATPVAVQKPLESEPSKRQAAPPGRREGAVEGGQLQRRLQQEKKEMALLKAEMQRRLKGRLAEREKKLDGLARQCEKLLPGEAVQILLVLEDETIADVLNRMDRNAALKIAALLKRHGRGKAVSFK